MTGSNLSSRIFAAALAASLLLPAAAGARTGETAPAEKAPAPAAKAAPPANNVSAVRVNATDQPWDYFHPWSKRAPYSRGALGAVLPGRRVLVTAELVADANYVELEKAESGEKEAATVEVVDYEANLAILKPEDEKFLDGIKPLELTGAKVGGHVTILQLENTGALLLTDALMTAVEVTRYPIDDTALLVYRLTAQLQYRESSFVLPVVKENKLVGMMMRYDTRTQNVEVIPAPVIDHFLKGAAKTPYKGFPRAGILFSSTRDPQLRRYAGLEKNTQGGVYITEVQKGSSAGKAGITVGDIVLSIGDQAIDQDGNYNDPDYGKISLVHLISTKNSDGEKVNFKVFHHGKINTVSVTLEHRDPSDYVIAPYTLDQAPRFYVLGGLIFQELSRQYLKEWGGDWQKKAPERFVYYDRYQSQLFPDAHRKIIFMSQVLPSPITIGYEELSYLIVTKINGVPINSMEDVEKGVAQPQDGYDKIEFQDNPKVIYLDAKQVTEGEAGLMQSYGLPEIKRVY